jgi:hypothetical protein
MGTWRFEEAFFSAAPSPQSPRSLEKGKICDVIYTKVAFWNGALCVNASGLVVSDNPVKLTACETEMGTLIEISRQ